MESISIHSLYAEGDGGIEFRCSHILTFQSTPSTQRETLFTVAFYPEKWHFNPLPLRRGRQQPERKHMYSINFNPLPLRRGRQKIKPKMDPEYKFQSTPSTQRETCKCLVSYNPITSISIHSLYAEGDPGDDTVHKAD